MRYAGIIQCELRNRAEGGFISLWKNREGLLPFSGRRHVTQQGTPPYSKTWPMQMHFDSLASNILCKQKQVLYYPTHCLQKRSQTTTHQNKAVQPQTETYAYIIFTWIFSTKNSLVQRQGKKEGINTFQAGWFHGKFPEAAQQPSTSKRSRAVCRQAGARRCEAHATGTAGQMDCYNSRSKAGGHYPWTCHSQNSCQVNTEQKE